MKTRTMLIPVLVIAVLLAGCNVITNVGGRIITPSDTIVTETRPVSGFDAIDFSTIGSVTLSQGNSESLTISGSDNIVPLIRTTVSNGTLRISSQEGITVTSFRRENLTLSITVIDLKSLSVSGLSEIQMASLSTPKLSIDMSGAGKIQLEQLVADDLNLEVSGLGTVDLGGEVTSAIIEISGAGTVNAADLKIGTANVSVPGLGSATVWVTDQLTGNISGAGTVSYYGSPSLNTDSSGLGSFKALGNK